MNFPTLDVDQWRGLINKLTPKLVGLDGFTLADNLRIDQTGSRLFARQGTTRVSSTPFRGAFATADGKLAYAITDAGELVSWPSQTVLRSGFEGEPYWAEFNDHVIVGNEDQTWRVYLDNSVSDNALPRPAPPILELREGSLPKGVYRFVAVNVGREESAPSDQATLEVDGTQSIYVFSPGTRVYICPANSTHFFQWRGSGIYSGRPESLGAQLTIRGLWPMPDGDSIATYQGALFNVVYMPRQDVSGVWRSKGLWHGLCNPREDLYLFPGRVLLLIGHGSGLLVGTEREIGAITGEGYNKFVEFGVAPGHAAATDEQGTIHLLTQRGFATAFPFQMVNDGFAPPTCDWVSAAVVREGGDVRLIAMVSISGAPDNVA